MEPPRLYLIVIHSRDIERAARFYECLGLQFEKHRHGSGPEHFASEQGGIVFEIYPRRSETDATNGTRVGFRVSSVDALLNALAEVGAEVIIPARDSPWGRRAVVADPDGHRVELVSST